MTAPPLSERVKCPHCKDNGFLTKPCKYCHLWRSRDGDVVRQIEAFDDLPIEWKGKRRNK